jgi:hypothetical protein
MRRGAGFESWLLNQGGSPDVAAAWAAHVVWASGFVTGRWGRPLAVATPAQLAEMAAVPAAEWARARIALRAWFEWVLPAGHPNPVDLLAGEARPRPHLRVVG